MESMLDWSAYVTPMLSSLTLGDAQLARYGRWMLAAAATLYASTVLQSPVPADTRHAITAYLPQGYDRSIVDARLQQRRSKELLHRSLQLLPRREQLRSARDRDAKLRGWEEVFRLTLAGMAAAAYTHSLTLLLFAVKNAVRVVVFVLQQREAEAAAASARRRGTRRNGSSSSNDDNDDDDAATRSGAFSRVRTWWSQGSRSVLTEMLLQRMLRSTARASASPFAHTGLGEEVTLPPVPAHTTTAAEEGGDDTTTTHDVDEQDKQPPEPQTTTTTLHDADVAMLLAAAERAFSVSAVLDVVVPQLVACARRVVDEAVASYPAGTFSAAGVVREEQLRGLMASIAARMQTAVDSHLPYMLHDAIVAASPQQQQQQQRQPSSSSTRRRRRSGRTAAVKAEALDDNDDDDADATAVEYEFPAGSTVMLDAHGQRAAANTTTTAAQPSSQRSALDAFDDIFGLSTRKGNSNDDGHALTPDECAERDAALRHEGAYKLRTAAYFTTLLRSRSIVELCVSYGDDTLQRAFVYAGQLAGVRSYDATARTAKTLLLITALDAHRQGLFDADFVVPPYVQLFCEEMVRSTCA